MPEIHLAEDNEFDAELIAEALREAAIPLTLAVSKDGERALAYLTRLAEGAPPPALFVLDLNLPRIGGIELLVRIRAVPALAHVPVVVFSGSFNPKDRDFALDAGADDFLQKPSTIDGFLAAVRRFADLAGVGRSSSAPPPEPCCPQPRPG
jgi:CheY-like chemotaxis protein